MLVGAYAFGRVSGAHFNPAVSVGAALGGRMAWRQVPVYVGAQLVGAIVAGLSLFILIQGVDGYDIERQRPGQNSFGDESGIGYAVWAAFLLELLMTAIFLYVILAVTDARNEHPALAPAAIGLTLSMIHFASINLTGTSVNPARSIGVGLFAGSDAIIQLWLFILAPLARGGDRRFHLPADLRPRHRAGAGLRPVFNRPRAPPRCRATARPTSSSRSGTSRPPTEQAAWEQEPIIQDGWQWDHAAQEWKPLEQWQPAPPSTHGPRPRSGRPRRRRPASSHPPGWSQPDPGPAAPRSAPRSDGWTASGPLTSSARYAGPSHRHRPHQPHPARVGLP